MQHPRRASLSRRLSNVTSCFKLDTGTQLGSITMAISIISRVPRTTRGVSRNDESQSNASTNSRHVYPTSSFLLLLPLNPKRPKHTHTHTLIPYPTNPLHISPPRAHTLPSAHYHPPIINQPTTKFSIPKESSKTAPMSTYSIFYPCPQCYIPSASKKRQ